ncbi:MAG: hypothetical protein PHW22_01075 [Bacilli bacterium]|nr:hypothetical protein [Bacilli bacterium]
MVIRYQCRKKVTIAFGQYEDCDGVSHGKIGLNDDFLSVSKLQYDYGRCAIKEYIEFFEWNIIASR